MDEWFKDWFNTKYYHILYKNRDNSEASGFIDRLITFLAPQPNAHFLDVACGKGRHSIYLNKKGYPVTGIDISPNSIEEANKYANDTLHFEVADMRYSFAESKYDIALNLFTSFGYFEKDEDDLAALQNICKAMQPNGRFVLDFFNASKVLKELVPKETKTIDGIDFHISKKVENNRILKTIEFESKGKQKSYTEKVEAITKQQFEELFAATDFEIKEVFGNYHLDSFDEDTSDRLIFVVQKTETTC